MSQDQYLCTQCGLQEAIIKAKWVCECGGLLQIKKGKIDFDAIEKNNRGGLWKYSTLISSFPGQKAISFGEGNTPLLNSNWENQSLMLKWEGLLPTGSYKDRGATTMISALAHLGVESIAEDSSGNAGAAIAWYARAAGMHCKIFAPAHASGGKLNTIIASGAKLIKVPGERERASEAALKESENSFYASHVWCPFFIEGVKTISYELWEQSEKNTIEQIVFPLGNGSLLLGIYKGFKELKEAGKILQIPKIIAVQAKNCSPLFHAFHQMRPPSGGYQTTLAEGIANANPPRLNEIIEAVRNTGGDILEVEESEIEKAFGKALQKGWIIEPTSAVSLAALQQISFGPSTVVIMTGSGLKINDALAKYVSAEVGSVS